MAKTIYITESQFKTLVEKKKEEKKHYTQINNELDQKKGSLTEAKLLNEGVVNILKKYLKEGMLTTGITASLLATKKVNEHQLIEAGVSPKLVEKAKGFKDLWT
jgi:hypothetical protein